MIAITIKRKGRHIEQNLKESIPQTDPTMKETLGCLDVIFDRYIEKKYDGATADDPMEIIDAIDAEYETYYGFREYLRKLVCEDA